MQPFASFIVCQLDNLYVTTTRAADRGENGLVGLPGGKIDSGETSREAAIREAAEEGWEVFGVSENPIHVALVDNKLVHWFSATNATPLSNYKEKGRIRPVLSPLNSFAHLYGNDFLLP